MSSPKTNRTPAPASTRVTRRPSFSPLPIAAEGRLKIISPIRLMVSNQATKESLDPLMLMPLSRLFPGSAVGSNLETNVNNCPLNDEGPCPEGLWQDAVRRLGLRRSRQTTKTDGQSHGRKAGVKSALPMANSASRRPWQQPGT